MIIYIYSNLFMYINVVKTIINNSPNHHYAWYNQYKPSKIGEILRSLSVSAPRRHQPGHLRANLRHEGLRQGIERDPGEGALTAAGIVAPSQQTWVIERGNIWKHGDIVGIYYVGTTI